MTEVKFTIPYTITVEVPEGKRPSEILAEINMGYLDAELRYKDIKNWNSGKVTKAVRMDTKEEINYYDRLY